MKKLVIIIIFLLPIAIIGFIVRSNRSLNELPEALNIEVPNVELIERIAPLTNHRVTITDLDITLNLEDYIIGVVAGEMPALFELEALKAQAVAARSFALSRADGYHVSIRSTIADQVFITNEELKERWGEDFNTHYTTIANAVRLTGNEVIKRDGHVLRTYYFAMSNGYTKDSMLVWGYNIFRGTQSRWDNEELTNFSYQREFTTEELISKLELSGTAIQLGNITRHSTNHVETIRINNQNFTGINFRRKLGLRSTDFDIEVDGNNWRITTRGNGHGVGMSQFGANGKARDGYNHIEILKHFYNNIEIANL